MRKRRILPVAAVGAAALTAPFLLLSPAATAAVPTDTTALRDAVTVEGITEHLQALQDIADANGGTRASSTPGHEASADYVAERLEDAGYDVQRQRFDFLYFEETSTTLEVVGLTIDPEDYSVMEYSGSGDVSGPLQAVDLVLPPGASANTSSSGCEAADFTGFTAGNVALMQRGTCAFADKVANAAAAGAVAAIVFNEGQEGRTDTLNGTLGGAGDIPAVGTSFALGEELADAEGSVATVAVDALTEMRNTVNVIAQTPTGRTDRVVVVGAHLDSVPEGPGINDNGSGSGTILEIAEAMSELAISPTNAVRFAFWGAEESGLLGSEHYVASLSKREVKDIALNLNFDMVASPNWVPFVYDGDGSSTGASGPNGSGAIESVFNDYLAAAGTPGVPTAFDGRSDYGPFIAVGVPAGGLFSGAEGVKTAEQAAAYGGQADEAYDSCYHQACDDIGNVSDASLDLLSDAAAHAVLTYASTTSAVNGTAKASSKAAGAGDHDGHALRR